GEAVASSPCLPLPLSLCLPLLFSRCLLLKTNGAALQEANKLLLIARQTGEDGQRLLIRRDDRVKRQRGALELSRLALGVLFIRSPNLVGLLAVGEKLGQHETVQRFFHLRIGKHILLHPAAIGAGHAGEVEEDWFVLRARLLQSRF